MQRTEKVIEINAPVERVFDLFSNFENFPRWMRHIKDVRYTGRDYTRWVADAPLGSSVEWEAETTMFEPDHRIAWRSVRGDIDTEGEVIFQQTRRGTTLMRVVLGYDPPAGRLGALVARLFGENPEQQLEEDLERFAEVAEGRRETRRARYADERERGERRVPAREFRERRPRAEYDYAARDADERGDNRYRTRRDIEARGMRGANIGVADRDDEQGFEYRARDDRERRDYRTRETEEQERRERESRQRFEEELRAARQSQQESIRRYREERERDEQRRSRAGERGRDERQRRASESSRYEERPLRDERNERRRDFDERRREVEDFTSIDAADDRRAEPTPRYPLTPREREVERTRREPDYETSKQVLRRGVDRLLDDPPSNRWRR